MHPGQLFSVRIAPSVDDLSIHNKQRESVCTYFLEQLKDGRCEYEGPSFLAEIEAFDVDILFFKLGNVG